MQGKEGDGSDEDDDEDDGEDSNEDGDDEGGNWAILEASNGFHLLA